MKEEVVTWPMVGLYLALGVDSMVLSGILSITGLASWTITAMQVIVVHAVFIGYAGYRWRQRQKKRRQSWGWMSDTVAEAQWQYANGKITESELRQIREQAGEPSRNISEEK
ncbi:hypothetical protein K0C01_11695 [Salinarchaeum sp. IM2453]|uniref:hypothetical protein n=1 Tax=Salinarchaeum sp. IM2453 TaxID=2862870 RepID=UPI001C831FF0|nr:hypothetical protein [Salinarchaeum sp. IM2453]QZA88429.1 hypothetical protein K0C01_11695 [Salinarchaeum sp. IM2453]